MEIRTEIKGIFQVDLDCLDYNNMILLENVYKWKNINSYDPKIRPDVISYLIKDVRQYNRFIRKFEQTHLNFSSGYFVGVKHSDNEIAAIYLPFKEGLTL